MHLASQDRVVLALEHRDGSGAATFPRSYNGAPHTVRYLSPGEVIWPDGATSPRANEWVRGGYNDEVALRLRKDQLDFRRREIYEAIHAIGLLHEGQRAKSALEVYGDKSINWDAWKGAIDTSNVDLIGHSFGGATVVSLPWFMLHLELMCASSQFSILSQPPPSTLTNPMKHYPRIPIRQTLALDPWMEPLPSPGPKPYSDDKNDAAEAHTHPQLLVINSEVSSGAPRI
jgi:platelet-activating factor acetylhydrolase